MWQRESEQLVVWKAGRTRETSRVEGVGRGRCVEENAYGRLECGRGQWNSMGSGGMSRYMDEHQWRRRLSGLQLTLRLESMGSEQD